MKSYKDMSEAEREEYLGRVNTFFEAAHNACKTKGTVFEFECPVCHGTARAIRSRYNGHHQAACTSCEMSFVE